MARQRGHAGQLRHRHRRPLHGRARTPGDDLRRRRFHDGLVHQGTEHQNPAVVPPEHGEPGRKECRQRASRSGWHRARLFAWQFHAQRGNRCRRGRTPTGTEYVADHRPRIAQGPDLTSLHPQPLNRDLGDDETEAPGQGQYFDIEGEALRDRAVEEQLGDRGPERLEAALRVVEVHAGQYVDDPIEGPVHQRPVEAGAVHRCPRCGARADGQVRLGQGADELRRLPGVDGHVRVGEGDDRRHGHRHARPHGAALAVILGEAEQLDMGEGGEQGAGPLRRVVGAAIVHDDEFGRLGVDGAGGDGGPEAAHAVVEPLSLVKGRDHQGEQHPGGAAEPGRAPAPPLWFMGPFFTGHRPLGGRGPPAPTRAYGRPAPMRPSVKMGEYETVAPVKGA